MAFIRMLKETDNKQYEKHIGCQTINQRRKQGVCGREKVGDTK